MGKFFAVLFLIVFAFWAYAPLAQASWFAPTPTPNYYWGNSYNYSSYSYPGYNYEAPFYGSQNAGWFNFNFLSRKSNVNVGFSYQQPSYSNYYSSPSYSSYPNYYGSSYGGYYDTNYYNNYTSGYSTCSYGCGASVYSSWGSPWDSYGYGY